MQLSASPRPGVVDARLRGHDVVVGKAPRLRSNLLAVTLVAVLLGSPGATAQDRSDAMLRAFQDACFPRLDDLASRRKKVVDAGFKQIPVDAIPELRIATKSIDLALKLLGPPDGAQAVMPAFETYQGQREGFELAVLLLVHVSHGVSSNECFVYDFAAVEAVSEKKVAAWLGRPADHTSRWSSRWTTGLPAGYDEVFSSSSPAPAQNRASRVSGLPGALLRARWLAPLQKAN
jgi:hypothetical protein